MNIRTKSFNTLLYIPLISFILLSPITYATSITKSSLSWSMAEEILTNIHDPIFPDYQVSVMDFDAKADGVTLDTEAFTKAIIHVNKHGGGTVVVPKGIYLIGSIELLSNVNLHLADKETRIKYTTDINEKNYPIAYGHWEASPLYNYRALIYANNAKNIALTGKGTLDGQASDTVWWNWKYQIEHSWSKNNVDLQKKASKQLRDMNNSGTVVEKRVFGDGHYLRPNFIQIIKSENVLLEGVTLNNSPMWQVNPVLSSNVTIRGMTLRSHGHNNDGIDPESSNYVLIENNLFDSGDDCIAIKSGRDLDGRKLNTPSQNIIIRNNSFVDGHGGIAMGSEMSGGIKNVFADNNKFDSPNLTYPLRFKTNARRGGAIENIYLRNSVVKKVNQATIHGTMLYEEGRNGNYLPEFKNIVIENLKGDGGEYGIFIESFPEVPVKGLTLRNIEINNTKKPFRAMNWADDVVIDNVKINGQLYPRPTETHISGVPFKGNKLTANSTLIGGNVENMTYVWSVSDQKNGHYDVIAHGANFTVPAKIAGKYLKVTAEDKNKATDSSIAYLVLDQYPAAGIKTGDHTAIPVSRIASKGFIESHQNIDMQAPITRIEIARMLSRMWHLTKPEKTIEIADLSPLDQDYNIVAAVIEKDMISLQDGKFNPNGTITREEMSSVTMMSCGVSYKNASTAFYSTFKDGDQIAATYLTNVERANYLGFLRGSTNGYFLPKEKITYAEAVSMIDKISDFAGM